MSWVINNLPDGLSGVQAEEETKMAYDYEVYQYDKERSLEEFKNDVTVVLNIASA